MDQRFPETKAIADSIEGMMSHFSMAAIDSLMSFQNTKGVVGDGLEIGVFRGKSAAILGRRLALNETLHLYDIEDYFDRDKLAAVDAKMIFNITNSAELRRRDFRKLKRSVRFCHIDASHQYDATIHEISLADYILSDDGILCLDDFANLNYSQILAATFKYLFTHRTDLVVFLVTSEKAYLCRKSMFGTYCSFVLNNLRQAMDERAVFDTCIAKTDDSAEYGAFHLRSKEHGETSDFYGETIFGSYYTIKPWTFSRKLKRAIVRYLPIIAVRHIRALYKTLQA